MTGRQMVFGAAVVLGMAVFGVLLWAVLVNLVSQVP